MDQTRTGDAYLVSAERRVTGPARFEERLPTPKEPFQDIAVLAFPRHAVMPTPPPAFAEGDLYPSREISAADVRRRLEHRLPVPPSAGQGRSSLTIDIEFAEALTARSLVLHPAAAAFAAQCELLAADDAGVFHPIRSFPLDRSNVRSTSAIPTDRSRFPSRRSFQRFHSSVPNPMAKMKQPNAIVQSRHGH